MPKKTDRSNAGSYWAGMEPPEQQPEKPTQFIDEPMADYINRKGMNASVLKNARKSMKAFKRAREEKTEPTDAMILGSGIHALLLEPEEFGRQFVVMPDFAKDPNNVKADGSQSLSAGTKFVKEAKARFAEENEGRTVIPKSKYYDALQCVEALQQHHSAGPIIRESVKEVTITGEILGIQCKARLDFISERFWGDVKTTTNAGVHAFGRQFANLNYAFQFAFYRRLIWQQVGKHIPALCIAQETSGDFDTVVYEVPTQVLDNADGWIDDAILKYKKAKRDDQWPGIDGGEDFVTLYSPNWSMEEVELDFTGVETG